MRFFKPKPPVDIDEFDWLLACFAWLHTKLGAVDVASGFVPQLARSDTPALHAAKTAAQLFEAIKALAGMSDWHCVLERGEVRTPLRDAQLVGSFSDKYALGTFSVEQNTPIIRYHPELEANRHALTSTLAHELAHLKTGGLGAPPGGGELHEHATDCAAVYMGFGMFRANSARHFEQYQDGAMHGWRSQTSGYLSERALVTATGLFVRLFGIDLELTNGQLKGYLQKDFAKALGYIDWRFPDVAGALGEVDLSVWR